MPKELYGELSGATGSVELELFFDGDCPLCRREIDFLKRFNRRGRVRFTDLAGADFDRSQVDRDWDSLMAEIHARLPDGTWVVGVEAFRRLYRALGWGWLVVPTRWPGVSWALDRLYGWFAQNRLRWTGRGSADCASGSCRVGGRTTDGSAPSPGGLSSAPPRNSPESESAAG